MISQVSLKPYCVTSLMWCASDLPFTSSITMQAISSVSMKS